MIFRRSIICLSAAVAVIIFSSAVRKNEYIGVKGCAKCHALEEIGNQYAVWQSSPHARAQAILTTDRGITIATKIGIDNPGEYPLCLKCHTTGGGRYEKTTYEGVGCEACHGPGGSYFEPSVHVNYSDRKKGYTTAQKYGMYPILGIEHLKNREKLCLSCHNEKRPCIPNTSEELLKKKMTIQVVDKLIRGDVKLRHPLRR